MSRAKGGGHWHHRFASPNSIPLPQGAQGAEQWRQLERATQEFLARVDAHVRTFVTLRFEEARAQAEVAERMQITRRKVRTLEEDVQHALRAFLKGRGLI